MKIPLEKLSKNTLIIDMSYSNNNPRKYPSNCKVISGYQVLKDQAIYQFINWNSSYPDLNKVYNQAITNFLNKTGWFYNTPLK